MIELIINADDFGNSESVNKAVIESFNIGIISSATVMVNMPGFEEACQLIHQNKLLGRVGIHLNLTQGVPLTDSIRRISRFCDREGRFCLSRENPIFKLNSEEINAVSKELEGQIFRCCQEGIPLTHADSHQHIHTEWAIGNIVKELVKRHRIPYLRLTRNIGADIPITKRMYKWVYNMRLQAAGLAKTQYFAYWDDFLYFRQKKGKDDFSCEVMVHPVLNDKKEVVDCNDMSLPLFRKIDENLHDMKIVSFIDQ